MQDDVPDLLIEATNVLKMNDQGSYTMPAPHLYPHQWLWDSCFIAIGLRHIDIDRAKLEIQSLLHGQWHNGMVPNIVFNKDPKYRADRDIWRSWINPEAPEGVATSGITQPPMIAEAVTRIGQKLPVTERRQWYRMVWPNLLAYHQWLYAERDPHNEGLALLIHPWECGLDNTPPWMTELHEHRLPNWIWLLEKLHLLGIIGLFRRDTKYVPANERLTTVEALIMFDIQRRLRRKAYNINKILDHSPVTIEDLSFNAILIRANTLLAEIASQIKQEIPESLQTSMAKTRKALEELWDPYSGQYYSRDFATHQLLKESSIATLMPLYAGSVTKERAKELVGLIENEYMFGPAYPLSSVPVSAPGFTPHRYWQGPSWVNTNWLIIDGLERYGFQEHATALRESTLEMIANSGCAEYFDPLTGKPAGAHNFSWTAALAIDLLRQS